MAKITASYLVACRDVNDKIGVCEFTAEGDTPEDILNQLHAHEKTVHTPAYDSLSEAERATFRGEVQKYVDTQANPDLRKKL